jgi:hypothetical protein
MLDDAAQAVADFDVQGVRSLQQKAALQRRTPKRKRLKRACYVGAFWSAAVLCRFWIFPKTTMCPRNERRRQTVQLQQAISE